MIATGSPSARRQFGVKRVCRLLGLQLSVVYARRAPTQRAGADGVEASLRRGPKPRVGDAALLVGSREVLTESHFVGEGHRKVRVRLKWQGMCASKKRMLR